MSASNTTENDLLKMLLQGTDPSWRAGATGYVALFTADPGETASLASEATYTGYARVAVTKSSGWSDGGSTFSNSGLIQFPLCTGGSNTLTHFAWVDTSSGAVTLMVSGALSSSLAVSNGIQPQFNSGELDVVID